MFGIDTRAARAVWTVVLMALVIATLYLVRGTLFIFIIAVLLAYLLAPLVGLVDRLTPQRVPRVISLTVVYVALLAMIGFGAAMVGSRAVPEASELAGQVPHWMKSAGSLADFAVPSWLEPWKDRIIAVVQRELKASAGQVVPLLGQIGKGVLSLIGSLTFLVLVPILSFFFLKDGRRIRDSILGQFAGNERFTLVSEVLADVNVLLVQYMRALTILAVATLVVYGAFFLAIGLPYAFLLATVAGLLEFIPMIGPLSAAVGILLVAILSGHGNMVLWILIFMGGYRIFQDYVLQPFLMSKGVELHPLWVIFGVLAGGQLGGVPGMFLSIPVLAILRVIYVRILKGVCRATP